MRSSSVVLAVLVPVVLVIITVTALVLFFDVSLSHTDGEGKTTLASVNSVFNMKTPQKGDDYRLTFKPRPDVSLHASHFTLHEIKSAEHRDQDDIAAYGDSQAAVPEHLRARLNFWKNKLLELTDPFLIEPKKNNPCLKFLTDLTWNNTKEYRAVEKKINYIGTKGVVDIGQIYKEYLEKPMLENINEDTASSWGKPQLGRLRMPEVNFIKCVNKWCKWKAADNKDVDQPLKDTEKNGQEIKNKFIREANRIYAEYKATINN